MATPIALEFRDIDFDHDKADAAGMEDLLNIQSRTLLIRLKYRERRSDFLVYGDSAFCFWAAALGVHAACPI